MYAVVGESTRIRTDDPLPALTPWFDGTEITLVAARGETLGLLVRHSDTAETRLAIEGAIRVEAYDVRSIPVMHPSTSMYGGNRGAGRYADALQPARYPTTDPAYFEIHVDAPAGTYHGSLAVGGRTFPIQLAVARVQLPPLPRTVWAYEDPREIHDPVAERACIDMFARHGVMLGPDIKLDDWPARKPLVAGMPFVPVIVPDDPAAVGPIVASWLEAFAGSDQIPFAIPVDEPHTPEARAKVKALTAAVHGAGGGPGKLLLAVTADPSPELGADLYISLHAHTGEWTYNGAPPRAGSMVLDAETPSLRTWGWIAWRYRVPLWYAWDALYWHDRYHGKRALDLDDPVSFDDGDDHGNLDGVLALPGCVPTLRLAALRRGLVDRQLLDLAAACKPADTAALAKSIVPSALGDAGDHASWSTDEATWELARRKLIELASCK
jgi:hypothetical protein